MCLLPRLAEARAHGNIAECFELQNKYGKAIEHHTRVSPTSNEPARRRYITRFIDLCVHGTCSAVHCKNISAKAERNGEVQ